MNRIRRFLIRWLFGTQHIRHLEQQIHQLREEINRTNYRFVEYRQIVDKSVEDNQQDIYALYGHFNKMKHDTQVFLDDIKKTVGANITIDKPFNITI